MRRSQTFSDAKSPDGGAFSRIWHIEEWDGAERYPDTKPEQQAPNRREVAG